MKKKWFFIAFIKSDSGAASDDPRYGATFYGDDDWARTMIDALKREHPKFKIDELSPDGGVTTRYDLMKKT